ncbi:MAG: diacylglycerol kinase family protein, partial [Candidatus Krumholzibacteriia bacterium]
DGLAETQVPLGIIPTGTGNLIARELGIPTGLDAAVALIAGTPRPRAVDAMRVGERVFVLNVSVGVSAEVVGDTSSKEKSRLGRLAYTWTTFRKLFHLEHRRFDIVVDGTAYQHRAVEVAILNCGKQANEFHPGGPEILIDDGHLDVYIVGAMRLRDVPRYLFSLVTRRPSASPLHVIAAKQRVTIRSTAPLEVQGDGDLFGTTPVEVELLPHAVTVLVPGDADAPA